MLRQRGEGLLLARNGDTNISAVPSSLAAVNSNCALGGLSIHTAMAWTKIIGTHNLGSQS